MRDAKSSALADTRGKESHMAELIEKYCAASEQLVEGNYDAAVVQAGKALEKGFIILYISLFGMSPPMKSNSVGQICKKIHKSWDSHSLGPHAADAANAAAVGQSAYSLRSKYAAHVGADPNIQLAPVNSFLASCTIELSRQFLCEVLRIANIETPPELEKKSSFEPKWIEVQKDNKILLLIRPKNADDAVLLTIYGAKLKGLKVDLACIKKAIRKRRGLGDKHIGTAIARLMKDKLVTKMETDTGSYYSLTLTGRNEAKRILRAYPNPN